VLREAADPSVLYGCKITEIGRDAADPHKTSIAWTQGAKQHRLDGIDLMIAADGRYSRVRRLMSGEPEMRQTGVAIFRLLVPDSSNGLIDDYEQWFNGPNRLLSFRVPPGHIYIAGTFPIAPDAQIAESSKASDALRAAYTPRQASASAQARWLIDTVCENAAETHWARMQEHELLYRAADCNVLYLGDAAHGMVPTLGQGATQALEDAANAAALITEHYNGGKRGIADWLTEIEAMRHGRMRFVMEFSLEATDTMLEGADPVAGTRHKNEKSFQDKLKALYRDVGLSTDGNIELRRQAG
jgi:salicylate hydroxylase